MSVRANYANWEEAWCRLAANNLHGIGSVNRLVYLPILIPAFSVVSEAFSHTGIGSTTLADRLEQQYHNRNPFNNYLETLKGVVWYFSTQLLP